MLFHKWSRTRRRERRWINKSALLETRCRKRAIWEQALAWLKGAQDGKTAPDP